MMICEPWCAARLRPGWRDAGEGDVYQEKKEG